MRQEPPPPRQGVPRAQESARRERTARAREGSTDEIRGREDKDEGDQHAPPPNHPIRAPSAKSTTTRASQRIMTITRHSAAADPGRARPDRPARPLRSAL